ncbi:MAG: glycoside hydrolase family 65 [Oscillospiraceae bacterium]|nr:glycoside hydrolase family 65 [Oscillospiraceae bacterium]
MGGGTTSAHIMVTVMIDRKRLVRRHNPLLRAPDAESPLTVGNGEFAFTADVTGLQTLYDEYRIFPLCAMSRWGWHTEPAEGGVRYTLDDVVMTRYETAERTFAYAVNPAGENGAVYDWLRHNPHRLNLARAALLWDGGVIRREDLADIRQELDLYSGELRSEFTVRGRRARVRTVCAQSADVLGFSVEGEAAERLSVSLSFPYGSRRKDASDWQSGERHTTAAAAGKNGVLLKRRLDGDGYAVWIEGAEGFERTGAHAFVFRGGAFTLSFAPEAPAEGWTFEQVLRDSAGGWERFWQTGGAADFSGAKDPRAPELERRAVLSQYLTAVQCAGSQPPQETGLSCNSWYGKFHLEMHLLHAGWFPLWGRAGLLERSLVWYNDILGKARENAARNGFAGARWPKMTGPEGIDSPSRIAPLLIWQQPHILYMLELIRRAKPEEERRAFMRAHWLLVRETARFMGSFPRPNARTGRLDLAPPLIPAQEEHASEAALNPVFELCYWRFGLGLAVKWAKMLGEDAENWGAVREALADPPLRDGLYIAHQSCPDTFTAFNRDHPSMLYGFGLIPCGRIDGEAMSRTADRALACWDKSTLWGWDFALCAMTLTRLGRPEAAMDVLLSDTPKNSYTASGNNFQRGRDDLPLYLPGNGALLFALPMLLEGYGETRGRPGLPKNGLWEIETEGISPLPY